MPTTVATIVTRCVAGAGGVAVRGLVGLDPGQYRRILIAGSGGHLLDQARAHGIQVHVVPELVSPVDLRRDVVALARLVRLLRRLDVDVVHTHSAKAGALGRVAARRVGVARVVHTLHGFPFHDFQPPATRGLYVGIERRLAAITDAFLAVGTAVAVEAIRLGLARPEQIRTIGPAVEPPTVLWSPVARARARDLLGLPDGVPVVGTVGRLDYQKAPEVMLEALARLGPSVVLVWAGDGPLMDETRRRVRGLGLETRVHLLGNRSDVPVILPAFDVFAMSSRYEGLPCSIVEAQQCGVPVVATAVNAVGDVVVPGESGLLVPPERPDLLAGALAYALAHPEQAAGWVDTARLQLGHRYDPTTLATTLAEVYRGGDRPGRPALDTWRVPA